MIITGCKTRHGYKMHTPISPYLTTHYIGYSLEGMKKKYRHDNGLEHKHIEWIIV